MSLFKPKVDRDEVNPDAPQSAAMAVLDSAQPLQVEGGEGKIHEMSGRHARLAMQQALLEARRHLRAAADPRPLVRQYPLPAIGVAAAVGLIGALALVPSEKQRVAGRLRAIERALRVESAAGGRGVSGSSSMGKRLFHMGMQYAKPALISMVTSALTGVATQAASNEPPEETNHNPSPSPYPSPEVL